MVFAIDASSANKPVKTGVERYAFHLIEAMKRAGLHEGEAVRLLSPSSLQAPLSAMPEGWTSSTLAWPWSRFWMQGRVSGEMLVAKPDTLFVPAQALPRVLARRNAVTLHDVAFHRRPDLFDPAVRRRLELMTRDAITRAHLVFTVSASAKRDLMDAYGLSADRIRVTPLAVDLERFHPIPEHEAAGVRSRYGLSKPYFLFIGRLEAKKNLATLVRAFSAMCEAGRHETELVLVGSAGHGFPQLQDEIATSADPTRVRELGYVPEADLPALLSAALAFCFPSHEEGFGIPVLEAMACGTPVIASDIPALRETGGDAARYVAPDDVEGWVQALRTAPAAGEGRDMIVQAGLHRAAEFSWDRTAALTWEGLRSL